MIKLGDKSIDFRLGDAIVPKIYQGDELVWYLEKLPSEYQRVEYIATDGACYIDTLLVPTPYCRAELDGQWLTRPSGNVHGLIDSMISKDDQRRFGIGSATSRYYLEMGVAETERYYQTDTDRHVFVLDRLNAKVAVDNDARYVSGLTVEYWTNRRSRFFIFARNKTNDIIDAFTISGTRCFGFKWFENNAPYAIMIPCYKKSNGIIGMYDVIRMTFFVNSGTGAFTKGPDVN